MSKVGGLSGEGMSGGVSEGDVLHPLNDDTSSDLVIKPPLAKARA